MLDVYERFAHDWMSLPVIKGVKTEQERFAGAIDTYCIEALMQDGKALQAGTSHFLGQNFAKAFDVQFTGVDGQRDYVWATSWGVSTRLMGALVMAHSDDDGLILPPKLAPIQVIIIPIYKGAESQAPLREAGSRLEQALRTAGVRVQFDQDDNHRAGYKFAESELKGIPIRIAIGMRDLEQGTIELVRRDTREKMQMQQTDLAPKIVHLLEAIQTNIYQKALDYRNEQTHRADTWDEFERLLDHGGGFISAHWDGTSATEERIKDLTKATIRCIPLDNPIQAGRCILTGEPSKQRVLFARAY
jgi:prolyl-tRNA synthetase